MAPPERVFFRLPRFPPPPNADVVPSPERVQVVVDRFRDAARTGIPSSSSLSEFFRKLACRSLSYSGTSSILSLPNPSSKAGSCPRRGPRSPDAVSSATVASGTDANFPGAAIADVRNSREAWDAILSPCPCHYHCHGDFQQVLLAAATNQQLEKMNICWSRE